MKRFQIGERSFLAGGESGMGIEISLTIEKILGKKVIRENSLNLFLTFFD
jgi:hypothetical protein